MQPITKFDHDGLEHRRAAEPPFRRFPSLLTTIPAVNAVFRYGYGGNRAGRGMADRLVRATDALEQAFNRHKPQAIYPYVWVRNVVCPIPDEDNRHQWAHEIMVSYTESDMPLDAPVQYDHGKLICCDIAAIQSGSTERFNPSGVDLVMKYQPATYLHPTPMASAGEHRLDEEDLEDCLTAPPGY